MLTYGFYNSKDHDRVYDAIQVGSIFDGIIEDGVYSNIGEFFAVVPNSDGGMKVTVKTGRAWFNHTWTLNDAWLPLTIEDSDVLMPRIDAVVLEVDTRVEKRENSIKVVTGTPSVNGLKPNLLNEGGVYQHPLAYVTVPSGATGIVAENIEIVVGKEGCPFVRAPLETVSIDDIWQQWDDQFNTWFDNLKAAMTDNVVTNLQYQIDQKVNISDKATEEDIKNSASNKWVSAALLKNNTNQIGGIVESTKDLAAEEPNKYLPLRGQTLKDEDIPEILMQKIQNRVLPFEPYINMEFDNNVFEIYCLSETMTIGDYDYLSLSKTKVTKINRNTRAIIKTVTVNSYIAIGVFESYIYCVRSGSVTVLDENLATVRTTSISNFSIDNDNTVVMNQLPTGRLLLMKFPIGSYSDTGVNVVSVYSDNYFSTYAAAGFTPSAKTDDRFEPNSIRKSIPYNKIGSYVFLSSSGRLFILPGYCANLTNSRGTIFYSDDYGTSFTVLKLRNVITNQSIYGSNSSNVTCGLFSGIDNRLVFIASGTSGSVDNLLTVWEMDCTTLTATMKKKHMKYAFISNSSLSNYCGTKNEIIALGYMSGSATDSTARYVVRYYPLNNDEAADRIDRSYNYICPITIDLNTYEINTIAGLPPDMKIRMSLLITTTSPATFSYLDFIDFAVFGDYLCLYYGTNNEGATNTHTIGPVHKATDSGDKYLSIGAYGVSFLLIYNIKDRVIGEPGVYDFLSVYDIGLWYLSNNAYYRGYLNNMMMPVENGVVLAVPSYGTSLYINTGSKINLTEENSYLKID